MNEGQINPAGKFWAKEKLHGVGVGIQILYLSAKTCKINRIRMAHFHIKKIAQISTFAGVILFDDRPGIVRSFVLCFTQLGIRNRNAGQQYKEKQYTTIKYSFHWIRVIGLAKLNNAFSYYK